MPPFFGAFDPGPVTELVAAWTRRMVTESDVENVLKTRFFIRKPLEELDNSEWSRSP
jgi:hypothetical protein